MKKPIRYKEPNYILKKNSELYNLIEKPMNC